MTVVEGSVGDVGMKPLSGTLFARPVTMRRQGDMVITTERAEFEIVAGQLVDVDMVPGPAVVTLEVGSDIRRNFRVTVPADGPVQLADLLEDAYEYSPEVVSVVAGYRNDARAARQGALDAAAAADGSAKDADSAAGAAGRSASDAADEATDAAESRRLAGLSADAAAGAAGTAGDHASAAAESKRLAEVAHQNTLGSLSGLTGRVTTVEGALPSKADLVGGKVPASQLPAEAMTDFLGSVGSQDAMLALTGQRGDWCTRTDRGTDWQLIAEPSTAIGSWREKVYPASPVSSVAGRTGSVILSKSDVGLGNADNTSDANKPISTATQTALAKKADLIGGRIDPAQLIGSGVSGTGIRVDMTVGTRVFVGETMIYGDTGWRNITSMLVSGWTGTRVAIRRVQDMVYIEAYNLAGAAATSTSVINPLPPGFGASGRVPAPALSADLWVYGRVISDILQMEYRTPRPDVARDLNVQYRTQQAWPTSLPGVAA